jgi:two-component system nitrate/nitrite response regulator NarL
MGADERSGRILLADPDERSRAVTVGFLREGGHEPSELASGEEVLEAARRGRPRLAILEICLPGICGYEVCRRLRDEYAETLSILFVSRTRTEPFDHVAGILLGADDYLNKPLAADEFLARVDRLIHRPATLDAASRLTKREDEVLGLLAEGFTQKEIAARLCISHKTVGTHLEHIFSKLGVHNRLQAVALAHRHHLVRPAA